MTLDKFLEEQQRSLEQFAVWWADQHEVDPEGWPLEMGAGDWDEQWTMFEFSSDNGDEDVEHTPTPQP